MPSPRPSKRAPSIAARARRQSLAHGRERAGEPGHGWQYFSDVRRHRAVVISPDGDYYYSRGKGLELVFKASGSA